LPDVKTRHVLILLALCATPWLLITMQPRDEHPAWFSPLPFKKVLAAAAPDAITIVDASASWCPPCRAMLKSTWPDARVRRWFDEHGTAVLLDLDDAPAEASSLSIRAVPTLIAFRGSTEIDRIGGYLDAGRLLVWLDGLLEGKQHDAAPPAPAPLLTIDDRIDAVSAAIDHERFPQAISLTLELLEARPGVKADPVIARLIAAHPAARAPIEAKQASLK
jgi:thioredoxin-like negative regulator of GroEL